MSGFEIGFLIGFAAALFVRWVVDTAFAEFRPPLELAHLTTEERRGLIHVVRDVPDHERVRGTSADGAIHHQARGA